jgi:hypothetical protein
MTATAPKKLNWQIIPETSAILLAGENGLETLGGEDIGTILPRVFVEWK